MYLRLLLCTVAVSLVAGVPINNCPQPTAQNPDPPAFFYGDTTDCTRYFTCAHGNPIPQQCPPGHTWSDFFQTCVGFNTHFDTCTRNNAERECSRLGGNLLIPHPTVCQRYYNCSDSTSNGVFLGLFEDECPYPQLFDVLEKKCKPYQETNCGPVRNTVGKAPCDYVKNLCGTAHCQPCPSRLPSCVGLPDGRNAHPFRQWTPYFIECQSDRTVNVLGFCPTHGPTAATALFSPVTNMCTSLWEVPREHGGLAPTCSGQAAGQYQSDERPDVYYTCPGAAVAYCGVGHVFNESTQQCE